MKKLIIVVFAVAVATVANAASINWSISNIYSASENGSSTLAPTTYTAMLFVTANSTNVSGFTLTTVDAVVSAISKEKWDTVSSLASVSTGLNTTGVMGGATGLSTDFSSGSLSAFAVILDTTTANSLDTASNYYLVNAGANSSASFTSASGSKMMLFGSQADNSALAIDSSANSWQAIPEPTSGLLMLVGGALLALKRKRA